MTLNDVDFFRYCRVCVDGRAPQTELDAMEQNYVTVILAYVYSVNLYLYLYLTSSVSQTRLMI